MSIVVVGSLNIDLFNYVSGFPKPGETIIGDFYEIGYGGKGANQAVMAKLLGSNVYMVGKVGNDVFGEQYIEHLKKLGINCDYISKCSNGISTGSATIIVNSTGENSIILNPGANKEVDCEYINKVINELLPHTRILIVQNEIVTESTLLALKLAKDFGVFTIFNTAPVSKDITAEFCQCSDILCCNEIEIVQLAGILSGKENSCIIKCAEILLEKGCRQIIVTVGANGAIYFDNDFKHGKSFPLPKTIDNVVDTTGSGDAFLAAFAYFMQTESSLSVNTILKCIPKSLLTASLTVTAKGAQSSYIFTTSRVKAELDLLF